MILCLSSDARNLHSAVGMVARLHTRKTEQFWFVYRQGVEMYCKASILAVGPTRPSI
jgi:hypothetical protein